MKLGTLYEIIQGTDYARNIGLSTDYGRQVRKSPSLQGRKIHSHSQIFRYSQRIFCLPHWSKFSDFFDLCLHWVSVVPGPIQCWPYQQLI